MRTQSNTVKFLRMFVRVDRSILYRLDGILRAPHTPRIRTPRSVSLRLALILMPLTSEYNRLLRGPPQHMPQGADKLRTHLNTSIHEATRFPGGQGYRPGRGRKRRVEISRNGHQQERPGPQHRQLFRANQPSAKGQVFSNWIYFLARLSTTTLGPVGWGFCGCGAACTLAPRRREERAAVRRVRAPGGR